MDGPQRGATELEFGVHFTRVGDASAQGKAGAGTGADAGASPGVRLVADASRSARGKGTGGLVHRLVEGENLAVMGALSPELAGSVSVAYLDPPYNTGARDFPYVDRFARRGEGRAGAHARYLSFLEPRLVAVRELLADDGLLFVSIDARELWGTKLLCDAIFSEASFLTMITVRVKAPAGLGQHGGGVFDVCEYVLAYVKDPRRRPPTAMRTTLLERSVANAYNRALLDAGDEATVVRVEDGSGGFVLRTQCDYHIGPVPLSARSASGMVPWLDRAFRTSNAQGVARFSPHVPTTGLSSVEFVPQRGRRAGQLHRYWFLDGRLMVWLADSAEVIDGRVHKRVRETNLWPEYLHQGLGGEGGVRFPNGKKPVALLARLLALAGSRDGIVLDPFAGSGSTGEAVLAANAADGGQRTFVCITDNSGWQDGARVADAGEGGICRAVAGPRLAGCFSGVRPDGTTVPRHPGRLVYLRAEPRTTRATRRRGAP